MNLCSFSQVLAIGLWLASPEAYARAEGSGMLPPSARMQVAGQAGGVHRQFPGPGWAAAAQVSSKGAGSGWGAVFTKRTLMGLALMGSGVYFIEKGFDFHREADALYQRYLDALDPAEISSLYQRTTQRDLKSRLSWTLGAVLAASGIHLLFGRQLAALHLQLAPPFSGTQSHGAQVQLSRDF